MSFSGKNSKKPDWPIIDMKEKLLRFCTCTAIEVMTAIGVTGYLLYLEEPILALISGVVFAKSKEFFFHIYYRRI